MDQLSRAILDSWQVRKSRKQKEAFIAFMQEQLPQLQVERSTMARNLVLGDVKNAKLLLTAHYDTCARLPFPNFITPKNIWVYLGYQLLIMVPFLALFLLVFFGLPFLGIHPVFSYWLGFAAMVLTLLFLMMGPIANPHTVNDNTSGVVTLCQVWSKLTPEQKQKVCLVFFDNEENGLLGSAAFVSRHSKDGLKNKLVLNFDCVSDGDYILFAANRAAMEKYGDNVSEAFPSADVTAKAFYPSDQISFPMGMGVAALKKRKGLGLCLDRIHTARDTVFQEENIDLLTEGTLRLLDKL